MKIGMELPFTKKNKHRNKIFKLVGIFENTQKVIDCQKRHFGRFWRLISFFLSVFKNTNQNNICVSIVLQAYTKKNLKNWSTPQKEHF